MKYLIALIAAVLVLRAQTISVPVGATPIISPPAIDDRGQTAVVASSVSSNGQFLPSALDLYQLSAGETTVWRMTYLPNNGATWLDLPADGSKAAYNVTTSMPASLEEIHVVDTSNGTDTKLAVDTTRCIKPLASAICIGCFFTCVRSVHLSPDASKVVYSASESQPLYVVNADGSGLVHLPIQSAVLASSPQRVVSRNGLLVFVMGRDVYSANLDGSNVQNLSNLPTGGVAQFVGGAVGATISEDGGTVAFSLQTPPLIDQTDPPYSQIYIVHPSNKRSLQLSLQRADASGPSLSADGSLVTYVQGGQAYIQQTNDSALPVRLTNFTYQSASAVTLSGDGSTALVSTGTAVYIVYIAGTSTSIISLFAPQVILTNGITSYSGLESPSPGSLIRISGWNLQDDAIVFADSAPLPASLGGITVRVNGQPIPLALATPTRIVAQLPFTTPPGATNFAIDFPGGVEVTASAIVKGAAPEVLQFVGPFFTSTWAEAFHAGTSTVADQAHPAAAGEVLEMYGLGLGAVSPAVDAGVPGPSNPPASAIASPQVKIGNQTAVVTFAGLAPGQVGIYQVDAVVPSGLKSGSQPVSWSVSGQPQSATWNIFVK